MGMIDTRKLLCRFHTRAVRQGGTFVKAESNGFPELYNLWLTVKELPYDNLMFSNVRLLLHRPDVEEETCVYDFGNLIRGYDVTDPWMEYPRKFIANDLFSRDEKEAIEAYLARHHFPGITLYKARQTFPIPNHWAPCNAAGYGAWEGEYMFDEEEGFDCPVKFWGYYWLGETSVVAGLAQVICESDGTMTIDGLRSPSTLMAMQADVLYQAWTKAKALGKAERLTVRYDLSLDRPLAQPLAQSLAYDRVF
jgi:hypothetical protein